MPAGLLDIHRLVVFIDWCLRIVNPFGEQNLISLGLEAVGLRDNGSG
jgi:hypothetical protein